MFNQRGLEQGVGVGQPCGTTCGPVCCDLWACWLCAPNMVVCALCGEGDCGTVVSTCDSDDCGVHVCEGICG